MDSKSVAVATAVGVVIGVAFGYAMFTLTWKGFHVGLWEWLTTIRGGAGDALLFAVGGAVIANGVTYLLKRSN